MRDDFKASLRKTSSIVAVASLMIIVFLSYANSVDDLDLWWHLKHGQFIYETHSLPQRDYFSYTAEIPENVREIGEDALEETAPPQNKDRRFWLINLKHSWLSELVFYVVYLLAGFKGLGILKSMVFVMTYLLLYAAMLKRGAGSLISFLMLCLVAILGAYFNYTRPQMFSFLLFTGLLYVLYDFERGGKSIYMLPVLMLLWANLHGGYILGVTVIFAFFIGESSKYLIRNNLGISSISALNKNQMKRLAFFSSISAVITAINPNGFKALLFPFKLSSSIFATTEESHRPMLYEYHEYWLMLTFAVVAIIILTKMRRLNLTDIFLFALLALPSLDSIRFIIFFCLYAALFIARSITLIVGRLSETKPIAWLSDKTGAARLDLKTPLLALAAVVSAITLIAVSVGGNVLKFDTGEGRYPSGAVKFIRQSGIGGKMFNLYNWGGYLIWNLGPERKVFIDGRALNETAFLHHQWILRAEEGQVKDEILWKKLIEGYGINYVLTTALAPDGYIYPLVNTLYEDEQWQLVYADGSSVIFVKYDEGNREIIHKNYLPKEKIFEQIIIECKHGIEATPATWGYYETLGLAYMRDNRMEEAVAMFDKYLSMNPYNDTVRHTRDLLKRYLRGLHGGYANDKAGSHDSQPGERAFPHR